MGKLEIPKIQGKYDTGQLFLHRIFGYRGVILFPWLAQVYDRDIPNAVKAKSAVVPTIQLSENRSAKDNEEIDDVESTQNSANDVKGRTNTFYQVLIDSRDCPFIVSCGINIVYCIYKLCGMCKFFSVLKPRQLHFWAIRSQTAVCTLFPVWTMWPMRI